MSLEAALNGGKAKRQEEVGSTLRFEIKLNNPTDSSTNEVHYTDLLGKENSKAVENALDPFLKDEDTEAEALARKFEEKYGSSSRKRIREEDLIDLGDGYDLNDPFVDDGEAYEDYVPHEVDTLLGGFYINAGSLEYKKAEGTEEIPLKKKSKPTLKKQTSTPKARLASKKVKLAKQQIATSAQRNETIKKKLSSLTKSNNSSLLFSSSKKSHASNSNGIGDSNTTSLITNNDTSDTNNELKKKESVFETPPTFPSDIPPSVESKIRRIQTMIGETEGKLTIKARYAYDSILVEIEFETREMKGKSRSAIFDYLAFIMGVTRASLMNRIKRTIKKGKGTSGGESTLRLLKEEIDKTLPAYVNKYDKEMADYEAGLKASASTASVDQKDKMETSEDFKTPSEAIKLPGEICSTKLKKPRKIFKWSPKLKSLLCDVVREKVEMEIANKERTKSGEDVIMEFLQTAIKPLWPKGWFVKKTLYNITQPVHTELTGYQKKVTVKKEKQTEDTQQKLIVPSPDLTVQASEEGSTSASFGSVLRNAPVTSQKTTPTLTTPTDSSTSTVAISLSKNNDTRSFEGIVKNSTLTTGSTPLKSQSAKPSLLPTKHFQGGTGTPPVVTASTTLVTHQPSSATTKPITPTKVSSSSSKPPSLVPVVSLSKPSKQPTTVAPKGKSNTTVAQKGSVDEKGAIITHKGGGGTINTVTLKGPVAQKRPVSQTQKGPIHTITQKGPTKVTKLTDIQLSQKDLDNLISSLRTNPMPAALSVSPQQLQLLLQHSPAKSQKQKPSNKSSNKAAMPPHSAKRNTIKTSAAPPGTSKPTTTSESTSVPIQQAPPPPSPLLTSPRVPHSLPNPIHQSSPTATLTPNWTLPNPTQSVVFGTKTQVTPNTGSVGGEAANTVTSVYGSPIQSPAAASQVVRKANISGISIRSNIGTAGNTVIAGGGRISPSGISPAGANTALAFNYGELPIFPPNNPRPHTSPSKHTVAHSSSGIRPHAVPVVQNQVHKILPYYSTNAEHNYTPSLLTMVASNSMVTPPNTTLQTRPSNTTSNTSTTSVLRFN